MKNGSAYLRKGKIFIQAFSLSSVGVWIAHGIVFTNESCDNPANIGANVLAALEGSVENIPHPLQSEWKSVQAPLLDAAGVKSWATFAKSSDAVGFELLDGKINFKPVEDYEDEGGVATGKDLTCSMEDLAVVGGTLLEAFSACK